MASGIASALGPLLGGVVLDMGGASAWRWIFWINPPIGARHPGPALWLHEASSAGRLRPHRRRRRRSSRRWRWRGSRSHSQWRPSAMPTARSSALTAAGGIVATAAFVWWERRVQRADAAHGLVPRPHLHGRQRPHVLPLLRARRLALLPAHDADRGDGARARPRRLGLSSAHHRNVSASPAFPAASPIAAVPACRSPPARLSSRHRSCSLPSRSISAPSPGASSRRWPFSASAWASSSRLSRPR